MFYSIVARLDLVFFLEGRCRTCSHLHFTKSYFALLSLFSILLIIRCLGRFCQKLCWTFAFPWGHYSIYASHSDSSTSNSSLNYIVWQLVFEAVLLWKRGKCYTNSKNTPSTSHANPLSYQNSFPTLLFSINLFLDLVGNFLGRSLRHQVLGKLGGSSCWFKYYSYATSIYFTLVSACNFA